MSAPNNFVTKVVGVTFVPAYPDNLHALREAQERHLEVHPQKECHACWPDAALDNPSAPGMIGRSRCRDCRGTGVVGGAGPRICGFDPDDVEPIPAVFVRNPDNEHDANAIEVHVPGLGQHAMIGHIPADKARVLAPSIDRGDKWRAGVGSVLVVEGKEHQPGVAIVAQRVVTEDA